MTKVNNIVSAMFAAIEAGLPSEFNENPHHVAAREHIREFLASPQAARIDDNVQAAIENEAKAIAENAVEEAAGEFDYSELIRDAIDESVDFADLASDAVSDAVSDQVEDAVIEAVSEQVEDAVSEVVDADPRIAAVVALAGRGFWGRLKWIVTGK